MLKVTLSLLVCVLSSAAGLRYGERHQVSLGHGRYVPIAGSYDTESEDLSAQESQHVRVVVKPPRSGRHQTHLQPTEPEVTHSGARNHIAVVSRGHSAHQHKPTPYQYGYDFKDHSHEPKRGSQQWRHEEGDQYGFKRGSYGYRDAAGLYRHVEYVADQFGYRATIRSNEPGLTSKNPAAVDIRVQSAAKTEEDYAQIEVKRPQYHPIIPVYPSIRIRKISPAKWSQSDLQFDHHVSESKWSPILKARKKQGARRSGSRRQLKDKQNR